MKEDKIKKKERAKDTQKELKEVKVRKKRISIRAILLYVAVFAFTIYSAMTLISLNKSINEKKAELAKVQHELEIVEINNAYLEEVSNYEGKDLDQYIEDIAREDLDYIKNGERVFYIVAGN